MRREFLLICLPASIIVGCNPAEQALIDWTDALAAIDCNGYDGNRDGTITREEIRLARCTIVLAAGLTLNTEALDVLAAQAEDDWLDGLVDLGCNVDYSASNAPGPNCFVDNTACDPDMLRLYDFAASDLESRRCECTVALTACQVFQQRLRSSADECCKEGLESSVFPCCDFDTLVLELMRAYETTDPLDDIPLDGLLCPPPGQLGCG